MRTRVFVNPAARKDGTARRWPEIRSRLEARLGPLDAVFSEQPGQMTALARQAVSDGVRRFVAIGGDGTVNETLNGMLDGDGQLLAPDSVLCPIPAGTANELSRALGHLDAPDLAFVGQLRDDRAIFQPIGRRQLFGAVVLPPAAFGLSPMKIQQIGQQLPGSSLGVLGVGGQATRELGRRLLTFTQVVGNFTRLASWPRHRRAAEPREIGAAALQEVTQCRGRQAIFAVVALHGRAQLIEGQAGVAGLEPPAEQLHGAGRVAQRGLAHEAVKHLELFQAVALDRSA